MKLIPAFLMILAVACIGAPTPAQAPQPNVLILMAEGAEASIYKSLWFAEIFPQSRERWLGNAEAYYSMALRLRIAAGQEPADPPE